jgi:glycine cleavage system H protein
MTTYYSTDHEWIDVDGDIGTVGITDHAQHALGDIVFVELPAVGKNVNVGGDTAIVESVKAASDVYSPVSGEIVEVNEALTDDPSVVNTEAETTAWFFKIKLSDASELDKLMNKESYDKFVG